MRLSLAWSPISVRAPPNNPNRIRLPPHDSVMEHRDGGRTVPHHDPKSFEMALRASPGWRKSYDGIKKERSGPLEGRTPRDERHDCRPGARAMLEAGEVIGKACDAAVSAARQHRRRW